MKALTQIIKKIPWWSRQIQSINPSEEIRRGLVTAHNFVTDYSGNNWTYGKSIGADGEYHSNGAGARYRLEELGFLDALNSPSSTSSIRRAVEKGFRAWAQRVTIIDLGEKLDRYEQGNLGVTFRLMVPPNFRITKELNDFAKKPKNKRNMILGARNIKNDSDNFSKFQEGYRKEIIHEVASRDYRLIRNAREKFQPKCAVCGFDFGLRYGNHGKGFIEFHHLIPLNEGKKVSSIKDIRPVCANCHRMLHRGHEIMSIRKLKHILS